LQKHPDPIAFLRFLTKHFKYGGNAYILTKVLERCPKQWIFLST